MFRIRAEENEGRRTCKNIVPRTRRMEDSGSDTASGGGGRRTLVATLHPLITVFFLEANKTCSPSIKRSHLSTIVREVHW